MITESRLDGLGAMTDVPAAMTAQAIAEALPKVSKFLSFFPGAGMASNKLYAAGNELTAFMNANLANLNESKRDLIRNNREALFAAARVLTGTTRVDDANNLVPLVSSALAAARGSKDPQIAELQAQAAAAQESGVSGLGVAPIAIPAVVLILGLVLLGLLFLPLFVGNIKEAVRPGSAGGGGGGGWGLPKPTSALDELTKSGKWLLLGLGAFAMWKWLGPKVRAGVERVRE